MDHHQQVIYSMNRLAGCWVYLTKYCQRLANDRSPAVIRFAHVRFDTTLHWPWSVSASAVATETISFILNSQHSYSLMRIGEPPKCSNNGDITRRLTKNVHRNNLNFYVTIKTMNMNIYHSKCYFG